MSRATMLATFLIAAATLTGCAVIQEDEVGDYGDATPPGGYGNPAIEGFGAVPVTPEDPIEETIDIVLTQGTVEVVLGLVNEGDETAQVEATLLHEGRVLATDLVEVQPEGAAAIDLEGVVPEASEDEAVTLTLVIETTEPILASGTFFGEPRAEGETPGMET